MGLPKSTENRLRPPRRSPASISVSPPHSRTWGVRKPLSATPRAPATYVAGVYREKASGARVDRPELLRMIADLQPGEMVIAEKIDRISRLPLPEAEKLITTIRDKGVQLAIPGVVDL